MICPCFRIAEKCSAESDGYLPQLYLLKHDIDHFQEQMTLSQSQRQNDIWTLLERAVNTNLCIKPYYNFIFIMHNCFNFPKTIVT